MERRIFDAEYGGHSPMMMVDEYGRYEERSVHAVILDELGPVAAARTIWSPSAVLPTKLETDLDLADGSLRRFHKMAELYGTECLSELATAVVEPRARGKIVLGWLLGEMRYQQMLLDPAAPSCAMIDLPFNRMIRIWGHELSAACGLDPVSYLGHSCQPTFFEPGPQDQIQHRRVYRNFSQGWMERVRRPLQVSPLVDVSETFTMS